MFPCEVVLKFSIQVLRGWCKVKDSMKVWVVTREMGF